MKYTWYDAEFVRILLAGDEQGLHYLLFESGKLCRSGRVPATDWQEDPAMFADVCKQLDEYFAGNRTSFNLRLAASGTDFQQRVWNELKKIPYGATVSYADIAKRIGNPKAVRAVGTANGANPISIIIPCHRVIGTNGQLAGYGGGLSNKQRLLQLEGLDIDGSIENATAASSVQSKPEPSLF